MLLKPLAQRLLRQTAQMLLTTLIIVTSAFAKLAEDGNQWSFADQVEGANVCRARLIGNDVDTMLMLNDSGKLLLVAGKPEWQLPGGAMKITLQIDNSKFDHLDATSFNNLVFLIVNDESTLRRLSVATNLYWSLPSGRYHAAVGGLGKALIWLHKCEHAKHTNNETTK